MAELGADMKMNVGTAVAMKKNQMNRRQFPGLPGSAGLFTLAGIPAIASERSAGGLFPRLNFRAGWEVVSL